MIKSTEAQLRLLDTAIRLSLNEDGLLQFVADQVRHNAEASIGFPAAEAAIQLGRIQAYQELYKYLLDIPKRLNGIDSVRERNPRE
jgi:hypothetical protein